MLRDSPNQRACASQHVKRPGACAPERASIDVDGEDGVDVSGVQIHNAKAIYFADPEIMSSMVFEKTTPETPTSPTKPRHMTAVNIATPVREQD